MNPAMADVPKNVSAYVQYVPVAKTSEVWQTQKTLPPPTIKKERFYHEAHGEKRPDDYHWLRNTKNPAALDYLKEWNAYTEKSMEALAPFTEKLYQEMVSRIERNYETVPYKVGDYLYYHRYVEDSEYPMYCRKHVAGGVEELLIDGNKLAAKFPYFNIKSIFPSNNGRYVALTIDSDGSQFGSIYIKDIQRGEFLEKEIIPDNDGEFAWNGESTGLWYVQVNDVKRSDKVRFHQLVTDPQDDQTIFTELDSLYEMSLSADKLDRRLFIVSRSRDTSEIWVGDLNAPEKPFRLIHGRQEGFLYRIVPGDAHHYFLTNNRNENTALWTASADSLGRADWKLLEPPKNEEDIDDVELFQDYLVVKKRFQGLLRFEVCDLRNGEKHALPLPQDLCDADFSANLDFNARQVRFTFNSPISPLSEYEYDMQRRELKLLRQAKAGGFEPSQYTLERLWVPAADGVKIPISIFYKKGLPRDGSTPLRLYGYGAYGLNCDPFFSRVTASFLERGVYCAIAHVRGGGELGYVWYEEGRLQKKRNSFTDFIDCADFLVKQGYTVHEKMAIEGGSAGGLLMGAVINMRPDLCKVCLADAPFVDVLTTMFDSSLPLTEQEWKEWGDPKDKEVYNYIKSYSPYDNVTAKNYPSLMVTSGLNDTQVSVHEPAKWVAKLLEFKTNGSPLYFKVNMSAGHHGASGRYAIYREIAPSYSFMLDQLGIKQ